MAKKCPKCNADIAETDKFCTNCGATLDQSQSTTNQSNNINSQLQQAPKPAQPQQNGDYVKYRYGFSYVITFRILYAIISVIWFIAIAGIFASENHPFAGMLLGLIVGGASYWFGMFSIKKFENIAITAKTIVELRNYIMNKDKENNK